jgi:peptidoglycan/xylan/chitin deacetylase (PgdA/CDA1 family)
MSSAIAFLFTGFIRDNILSVKKPVNIQHRKKIITTALSSVLVIAIGIIAYGYFAPTSQVFGKVYYRAKSAEKLVALTFDDGPNEPYTSQILDILATHDIKATFFVTGYNVGVYPETAERILAEGHVVGNHSYSHYANHALTNLGCRDLELGEKVIFETMGIRPHLYRPPHGKKSPWEEQYIKKENMILVNWSAAANDGFDRTPEAMARHILADTKPGGIILLHDGYGNEHGNANADKSLTVATLEIIIKELQTQGYRFVTVPQLFGVAAYNSPG